MLLHSYQKPDPQDKDTQKQAIDALRQKLFVSQQTIKEAKLPVLVLIEGWGAAGKGSVIGKVISSIDPRSFRVSKVGAPTDEDRRKPFLWRHFVNIPEAGNFLFLDSGWMKETVQMRLFDRLDDKKYAERLQAINTFERQLVDNGYLLLKLFFHIDKKEQKKRIEKLLKNEDTAWRVGDYDEWQTEHYSMCFDCFDDYLHQTNTPDAPWHIIDASDKKQAEYETLSILTDAIDKAIKAKQEKKPRPIIQKDYPLEPMPLLSEIDLNKSVTLEEYETLKRYYQKKLRTLHNRIYRQKIPVIIAYEGWDAAGKGGNIKRIASALDPRGYEVIPIASPKPFELSRHYLWRFYNRLPKTGHITIFDRTWYGRVMVERLEGFCSEADWKRAYNEINEFERELTDWGAVLLKFWIHIDKDTQLARFTERQNTPEKQWKITDEDWRNREKWDLYEEAVNEMIQKTSTKTAPWHIIESNDKKYARIKTLKIVTEALEDALKKREK